MPRKKKEEVAAVVAEDKKHGGARDGAGRPSLYGDRLDARFSVKIDNHQAEPISAWCVEHGVNINSLFREAALEAVGASSLGMGVDALAGKTKKVKPTKGGVLMIRCTTAQDAAIRTYCAERSLDLAVFVREATLARLGLSHLGIAGTLAQTQATANKLAAAIR